MCIQNDVLVHVYLHQKGIGIDFFNKHPLCIILRNIDTTEDVECGIIVQQTDSSVEAMRNISKMYSYN